MFYRMDLIAFGFEREDFMLKGDNNPFQLMYTTGNNFFLLLLSRSLELLADDPFADDGCIGCEHPKKYPGNFCSLGSGLHLLKQVMIFFITKTTFQYGSPYGA